MDFLQSFRESPVKFNDFEATSKKLTALLRR